MIIQILHTMSLLAFCRISYSYVLTLPSSLTSSELISILSLWSASLYTGLLFPFHVFTLEQGVSDRQFLSTPLQRVSREISLLRGFHSCDLIPLSFTMIPRIVKLPDRYFKASSVAMSFKECEENFPNSQKRVYSASRHNLVLRVYLYNQHLAESPYNIIHPQVDSS